MEYGVNSIKVLEGLDAVRERPGMYIGSTGPAGIAQLIYEAVYSGLVKYNDDESYKMSNYFLSLYVKSKNQLFSEDTRLIEDAQKSVKEKQRLQFELNVAEYKNKIIV